MSRVHNHLSLVVDEVLAEANASAQRRDSETRAVKEAAAVPRTDLGRALHALAATVRDDSDDITYADLARGL